MRTLILGLLALLLAACAGGAPRDASFVIPEGASIRRAAAVMADAGAIEAAFAWLTLVGNPQGRLPGHWWDGERDPALAPLRLVEPGESLGHAPRHVMSNSFAFGGSNACVLLSQA